MTRMIGGKEYSKIETISPFPNQQAAIQYIDGKTDLATAKTRTGWYIYQLVQAVKPVEEEAVKPLEYPLLNLNIGLRKYKNWADFYYDYMDKSYYRVGKIYEIVFREYDRDFRIDEDTQYVIVETNDKTIFGIDEIFEPHGNFEDNIISDEVKDPLIYDEYAVYSLLRLYQRKYPNINLSGLNECIADWNLIIIDGTSFNVIFKRVTGNIYGFPESKYEFTGKVFDDDNEAVAYVKNITDDYQYFEDSYFIGTLV